MKSKISFFNKGVFWNIIKRYWPAWALYSAFWLLAMPIELLSNVSGAPYAAVSFVNKINTMCDEAAVVIAFVSAIIVAMGVFSFMYRQRETSMIASLPVRREAVFGSAFLSGLIPVVVINAVIGLLSLLTVVGSINGECVNAIAIWYGTFILEFIAFYGIACFIATITGSFVALPIFYGIFNFIAISIESVIRGLIEIFVYGVNVWSDTVTEALNPVIYLISKTTVYIKNSTALYNDITGTVCPRLAFDGWGTVIIYAAVGLILAACGMLIYRKRKMECTGDVVAIPALKPVFKYGVSICAAICFGLLMYMIFWDDHNGSVLGVGGFIALVFFMAVGGAIGYFGADMLNKKSAHVFRDNWGGYFAIVIFCVVLCAVCRFDLFGIGKYVPDANDIEGIKITGSYSDVKLLDESDIKAVTELHGNIVASLDEISKETDEMFNEYNDEYFYSVYIEYYLKNGKTVSRAYQLRENRDEAKQFAQFMESEAMRDARCAQYDKYNAENVSNASLSYSVNNNEWYSCELTAEQAIDLYKNAISLDIKEGHMSFDTYLADEDILPTIWIEFADYGTDSDCTEWMELACIINPECVHTIQWFKDNIGADIGGVIHEPIVNPEMPYYY